LNKPTSEVLVNVSCNEAVNAGLWITYTVSEAGWIPAYDLRARDVQNPVQLIYNARVFKARVKIGIRWPLDFLPQIPATGRETRPAALVY